MTVAQSLALMLDPTRILRAQGMPPDPWQRDLLLGNDPCVLLNCSRQAGKSTTVAALAVHQLLARGASAARSARVAGPAREHNHALAAVRYLVSRLT